MLGRDAQQAKIHKQADHPPAHKTHEATSEHERRFGSGHGGDTIKKKHGFGSFPQHRQPHYNGQNV